MMLPLKWVFFLAILLSPMLVNAQDSLPSVKIITPENASQLTKIGRYGSGIFTGAVAWSPDGSLIVVGSSIGLWFYDAQNPNLPPRLKDLDTSVEQLQFSLDGRYLVYAAGQRVYVMDMATDKTLLEFSAVLFTIHPDNQQLAIMLLSATQHGMSRVEIQIWNIPQGEITKVLTLENFIAPQSLAFSPDGETLMVSIFSSPDGTCGYDSSELYIWHLSAPQDTPPETISSASEVRFAADGTLATLVYNFDIQFDGSIQLFDTDNQATYRLNVQDNYGTYVYDFSFRPDHTALSAISMTDSSYYLNEWDTITGDLIRTVPLPEPIKSLAFNSSGAQLVLVADDTLYLGGDDFSEWMRLPLPDAMRNIEILPNTTGFHYIDSQHYLQLVLAANGGLDNIFELPLADNALVATSADGSYVAYANNTDVPRLEVWDTIANQLVWQEGLLKLPTKLYFSPNHQLLAVVYQEIADDIPQNRVEIWHLPTQHIIELPEIFIREITLVFSHEENQVGISTSWQTPSAFIFDADSGDKLFEHTKDYYHEYIMGFTPNFNLLATQSCGWDRTCINFLDTQTNALAYNDSIYYSYSGNLQVFSPDSAWLLYEESSHFRCGGDERRLHLVNIPIGQSYPTASLPPTIGGYRGRISSFSPDSRLYTAYNGIFEVETQHLLTLLPIEDSSRLFFNADNTLIFSQTEGLLRLWSVPKQN